MIHMAEKNGEENVVLRFDNQAAADQFVLWLCEQGEQDYWNWMEHREQRLSGPITGTEFKYNSNSAFGKSPILVKCGRLTADRDNG